MTAIILAGGEAARMGGKDKSFLTLEGETFISRKIRELSPLFTEIIVVGRGTGPYLSLPVKAVTDEVPGQGPLMGLFTGLKHSLSDLNFVTTVDSPYVSIPLVTWLLENIGDFDAHVPRRGRFTEPLFAAYRKTCLTAIEEALPEKRIISFYSRIRVKYTEEERIRDFDPEFLSFININSRTDYEKLKHRI